MKKGEKTRRHIINKSAELFNLHGYAGVSLNDITHATGIQKGGLYKHFVNKDEIAVEAFEFAADTLFEKFTAAVRTEQAAKGKLISIFALYSNVVDLPPFVGGCPVMNAAIEHDDGHPLLREQTRERMRGFLALIKNILQEGITNGEFKSSIDLDGTASFLMAALEGGIMMSKLEADNRHIHYSTDHISVFLKTLEV